MRRFLPLVLLLAACVSDSAVDTTRSTVPVREPTTTSEAVVETTTTTEPEEPVSICGRARLWEPGVVYTAPCFIVPNAFEVAEDGWRSTGAAGDWLFGSWVESTDVGVDQGFEVGVAVTARPLGDGPVSRVSSIVETEGVSPLGEPTQTVVVGLEGVVFDVEGEKRVGSTSVRVPECGPDGEVILQTRDRGGYLIAPGPERGDFFGVNACQVVRVWVLEAGDFLVTIIGGAADPARHDEAVAKVEKLFEGMSFEVAGS